MGTGIGTRLYRYAVKMMTRQKFDIHWVWVHDEDEFFLWNGYEI